MAAPIVPVDPAHPAPDVVARAAALIVAGSLVAVPTETVYGLAANALDAGAVARIYAAKGRPAFNPLIVHLADVADLPRVAREIPPVALELAARFWPGPLTLVLHRQPVIPDIVTAGLDTVGVRIPRSEPTRALIRAAGVPLAAPSANTWTRTSPTSAAHVAQQLGDKIALILDAGPTTVGIESTVLDLTTTPPRLLRPGGVSREQLEAVLGPVTIPAPVEGDAPRPSPGMVKRHYAPNTTLCRFGTGEHPAVLAEAAAQAAAGRRVAVLAWSALPADTPGLRRMPDAPAAYARELYGMLHALDDDRVEVAFIEDVPRDPAWDAVRDRLTRASTPT